jgi:cephalosporin-C deacetylase
MDIDPAYGYSLPDLLGVSAPPPPADFARFWSTYYDRARDIDPLPVMRGSGPLRDVEFTSLDDVRIGGWLSLPADGLVERGLVVGHGYGGRLAPDAPGAAPAAERTAVLYFCARGMPERSRWPGIPDTAKFHVLHGISARESYVHGGCVADLWCAVTALSLLVPDAAARIDYAGGSFGGGTGALALPWDDRISRACLWVPSFGNHPLRLTMPCTGSGEAVREYARDHPEVVEVLRYFDAATAAAFVRVPTHVGLALADAAVPPPGQFAVFNSLGGPRERFLLTAGHTDYPGRDAENRALLAAQRKFLAEGHDPGLAGA